MRAAAIPIRSFCLDGLCMGSEVYRVDPVARVGPLIDDLRQGSYAALHAPPSSGLSTTLEALARTLTARGCNAIRVPLAGLPIDDRDLDVAERLLLTAILRAAARRDAAQRVPPFRDGGPWHRISVALCDWQRQCDRPIILMFDDVHRLPPAALGMLRAQLAARPGVHAVLLAGISDLRSAGPDRLGRDAPLHRLPEFDRATLAGFFDQHAQASGDRLGPHAVERLWLWTGGQPWLVNATARTLFDAIGAQGTVTVRQVDRAIGRLLDQWPLFFDQLTAHLSEPDVRRALLPLLTGSAPIGPTATADLRRARAVGLLAGERAGPLGRVHLIAALRVLTRPIDARLTLRETGFRRPDGRLDLEGALGAFAWMWQRSEANLLTPHPWPSTEPALHAYAFLQRLLPTHALSPVAGYGARQLTLDVELPLPRQVAQRLAIVIKMRTPDDPHPLDRGLADLDAAITRLSAESGALMIFDGRRGAPPLEERTGLARETTPAGHEVVVVRG